MSTPAPVPVPYLGPGADRLSKEDYERIYKNYIQTSILLGYPFFQQPAQACNQALSAIFRQAGMFDYPVPAEAQQVLRSTKVAGARRLETYEMGGVILQVARSAKTGALDRLVHVNSGSPRATRRLLPAARKELLELQRDPITGLERLQGVPVGFPHPLLNVEGQGLYVKELRFNGKVEGCEPLAFQDNAWVGGYDLSESRCTALQADAERVWNAQLEPSDFAERELQRMRDAAQKAALAKGAKETEAKALVEKHFVPPLTNSINVVGSAMRNLAQCNLLALGRAGKPKLAAPGAPNGENPAATGGAGSGAAQ